MYASICLIKLNHVMIWFVNWMSWIDIANELYTHRIFIMIDEFDEMYKLHYVDDADLLLKY